MGVVADPIDEKVKSVKRKKDLSRRVNISLKRTQEVSDYTLQTSQSQSLPSFIFMFERRNFQGHGNHKLPKTQSFA